MGRNEPFNASPFGGLWSVFSSPVIRPLAKAIHPLGIRLLVLPLRGIVCAETIPSSEAMSFSRGISLRFIRRTPIAGCAVEAPKTNENRRVGFFLLFLFFHDS